MEGWESVLSSDVMALDRAEAAASGVHRTTDGLISLCCIFSVGSLNLLTLGMPARQTKFVVK